MSEQLQHLVDPALSHAIEANLTEEMAIFGRGPGAELHDDAELYWIMSGKPRFNGVLRTQLAQDDPAYINRKIAEKIHYFSERQLPFSWTIGPTTYPAHLAEHLEAHGIKLYAENIALAADIRAIREETRPPADFRIDEVTDVHALQTKCTIDKESFGDTDETAQSYYEGYVASGFGPGKAWRHYLGKLNGEAIAISSLLLHAGVAGIYGVGTLPPARRLGIGTLMTLHALHEAHAEGYRIACLTATSMSNNIYHRLGFRDACTLQHYRWIPKHE